MMIMNENSITSHVQFTYTTNWFIIKLNDIYYKYDLSKSQLAY